MGVPLLVALVATIFCGLVAVGIVKMVRDVDEATGGDRHESGH
jgi:hypothetical protein